jgi:hypothetical protein
MKDWLMQIDNCGESRCKQCGRKIDPPPNQIVAQLNNINYSLNQRARLGALWLEAHWIWI